MRSMTSAFVLALVAAAGGAACSKSDSGKASSTKDPIVKAKDQMEAVKAAAGHESWQKTLKQNHWESSLLSGPSLASFIDFDMTTSRVMVHLLKLKA